MSNAQPDGYLALPETGNGKAVLVVHAWWGLNATIKAFCKRLADAGFVAFAPDLYHGKVTDTIVGAEKLVHALSENDPQAKAAVLGAAKFLVEQTGQATGKVAVIGFSMGAFYALDLSAAAPELVHSVVLFYGTGPADFSQSNAAYLGHFAENDPYEPQENVDGLAAELRAAGRPATFYQYPGTGHWFFEPDRADAYDAAAAELAWQRTLEFLRQPYDDDLSKFAANSALPLPATDAQGYVEHDGARIWYASYGSGTPVILLHGGLGNSNNWGYQVPVLMDAGYRAIVIDSRGHGRSTRDERPYSYELMAGDVAAVMNKLGVDRSALVGWSDGACVAMILADQTPGRVSGVFFFGCNMDPSGTKEFVFTPIIGNCFDRHVKDYKELSATPDRFDEFSEAVGQMQRSQPNYTADDLARISVPVAIVQSEHDEFIKPEHAEYLVRSLPNAEFIWLEGVSHFAPLQRPDQFNRTVLTFLHKLSLYERV